MASAGPQILMILLGQCVYVTRPSVLWLQVHSTSLQSPPSARFNPSFSLSSLGRARSLVIIPEAFLWPPPAPGKMGGPDSSPAPHSLRFSQLVNVKHRQVRGQEMCLVGF